MDRDVDCPKYAINPKAKIGAIANLKAVAVKNDTLFKTYLLMAVDDPHRTPAKNARSPAIAVPASVPRFTLKSLKVTKYAAISAINAHIINLFVIFSLSNIAAMLIAQIG